MLEVARALVADPSARLVAPVVFAFNGGEETFSQARCLPLVQSCVKGKHVEAAASFPLTSQMWQSSRQCHTAAPQLNQGGDIRSSGGLLQAAHYCARAN